MLFEVAVSELSAAAARSWLSPVAACAAELAAVVCVAASPSPRANARMIDSGSQFAAGWRAPTWASRPSAVGRWLGSLARQRSISGRTSAGT